jgi:AbrB family looped-hinge helix DNA binding protein
MAIARSKVTAQGQISVPAEIRRRLGAGPGAVLEWDEDGDQIIVRRAGRHSSIELHQALFPESAPRPATLAQLKDGVRTHVRRRRARR